MVWRSEHKAAFVTHMLENETVLQSGLEAVDQCVVMNAGTKSGKEVACGLMSQIHVAR